MAKDIEVIKPVGEICHYDPVRDISPVVASDIIDLSQALIDGIVPDNVIAPDAEFDGTEEPESIIGRPANEFEAIHMSETIKVLASSSDKTEDA